LQALAVEAQVRFDFSPTGVRFDFSSTSSR
jgi:hypothetical protein